MDRFLDDSIMTNHDIAQCCWNHYYLLHLQDHPHDVNAYNLVKETRWLRIPTHGLHNMGLVDRLHTVLEWFWTFKTLRDRGHDGLNAVLPLKAAIRDYYDLFLHPAQTG
jgi:hypothetical protein